MYHKLRNIISSDIQKLCISFCIMVQFGENILVLSEQFYFEQVLVYLQKLTITLNSFAYNCYKYIFQFVAIVLYVLLHKVCKMQVLILSHLKIVI